MHTGENSGHQRSSAGQKLSKNQLAPCLSPEPHWESIQHSSTLTTWGSLPPSQELYPALASWALLSCDRLMQIMATPLRSTNCAQHSYWKTRTTEKYIKCSKLLLSCDYCHMTSKLLL